MLILVQDTAESVSSAYVEVSDSSYVCDRCGDSPQGCGLPHGLVGSMGVVELLVLVQGMA
jgi:hypothetical protein